MIYCCEVTLKEIIDLETKGMLQTRADMQLLESLYDELSHAKRIRDNGPISSEQYRILRHVRYLIQNNVPKLHDILKLFDISFDDVFEGENARD